jgi:hypothetical protein
MQPMQPMQAHAAHAQPHPLRTRSVYVTDKANCRIRMITSSGVVTTLAGSGAASWADGTGTAAEFNYPTGLALSSDGTTCVRIRVLPGDRESGHGNPGVALRACCC